MVIRPAAPQGYSFVSPLKTTARRRMTPTSIAVLSAVAAAHLGLAVYLYGQHFTPSRLEARPEPPPFVIELPRLEPDKPLPKVTKPQPRTLPVHVPRHVALQQTQHIEVQPQPPTSAIVDPAKTAVLPSDDGSQATPQAKPPSVITDPHWLRQPSGDDLADVYPERALALGRSGFARLACIVIASGDLVDCRVYDESPPGWGFGAAAMKLIKRFRLVPRQVDGRSVDGAMVLIPIRFSLRGE